MFLLLFSRWFQFVVLISSLTEELFLRKFSHIQHVCCCVVLAWWGFISILFISTCIVVRKMKSIISSFLNVLKFPLWANIWIIFVSV